MFRNIKELPISTCYNQLRSLPRWSARSPKKVYLPESNEIEDNTFSPRPVSSKEFNYPKSFSFKDRKFEKEILTTRKTRIKPSQNTTDMLETVIDGDGNLVFTKMKDNDPRITNILSNLKSEGKLKKTESFFVEGRRIIKEALQSGCKLQYLLFSRKSDVEELKSVLPKSGAQIYKVPYREMGMWSDLVTNPGIMGVFKKPKVINVKYEIPVNVICDNIREPGNLGSILRTCAAVGCKSVILTKGCCDIWNSKVLRGGMGGHFKLNIEKLDWPQIEEKLSETNWFIADNNIVQTSNSSSLILDLVNNIPVESYDLLKYTSESEISLVIGGETEGISEDAYKTVGKLGGIRLHIPLINDIESLNCSIALGVFLFEMRKQIKQH